MTHRRTRHMLLNEAVGDARWIRARRVGESLTAGQGRGGRGRGSIILAAENRRRPKQDKLRVAIVVEQSRNSPCSLVLWQRGGRERKTGLAGDDDGRTGGRGHRNGRLTGEWQQAAARGCRRALLERARVVQAGVRMVQAGAAATGRSYKEARGYGQLVLWRWVRSKSVQSAPECVCALCHPSAIFHCYCDCICPPRTMRPSHPSAHSAHCAHS